MRNEKTKAMALGGILAALAVALQMLGGLIPVATFVLPIVCLLLGETVRLLCGQQTGWAWYGCVAILVALMGPDKEAGMLYLFLGAYPMIRPKLEKLPVSWLWKLLAFNGALALTYGVLLGLMGMDQIAREYESLGTALLAVTILAGNLILVLVDRLLVRLPGLLGRRRKTGA